MDYDFAARNPLETHLERKTAFGRYGQYTRNNTAFRHSLVAAKDETLPPAVKSKYDHLLKNTGFIYDDGVGSVNLRRLNLGEPNCPEYNFTFSDARLANDSLSSGEHDQVMLLKNRLLVVRPPKFFFEEGCTYEYSVEPNTFRS